MPTLLQIDSSPMGEASISRRLTREFVQMVLAQRAYESNSKVIKAADDMYSQVNNMTR